MGRKRKYNTEEERIAARKESRKRWRENNKGKVIETQKRWREKNQDYFKDYQVKNAEALKKRKKEYYENNKELILKNQKEYKKEYNTKRRKTPIGRASNLISAYNQQDRINNRGRGDLIAKWVVENILFKPCTHCGKEGWEVIGCNRLDNSLPHTMNNVEPCCWSCNSKLARL